MPGMTQSAAAGHHTARLNERSARALASPWEAAAGSDQKPLAGSPESGRAANSAQRGGGALPVGACPPSRSRSTTSASPE
jgi:hypothetical protein